MKALMKLSDVAVSRGGKPLLSALNCVLHPGQVVVVLGPNGAGKSSLLLALAGLIPADGVISISGQPLSGLSKHELTRHIAWQGDLPPTEFGLTVRQRLELAAGEETGQIEVVATDMDIAPLLSRALGKLSSGERQRTELAALMLRDVPIWLLDEPAAHLDLKHQIRCMQMLREQRARGRAMMIVLHDIQQAMSVADYLILIDGKGAVEYGEAETLFDIRRLSQLFAAPLKQEGSLLIPDYRGTHEAT